MIRHLSLLLVGLLCWTSRRDAVNASSVLVQGDIHDDEHDSEADQHEPPRGLHEESNSQRSLKLWLPQSFPNPTTADSSTCRNGRICDPDSVLTLEEMDALVTFVQHFEKTQSIQCAASAQRSPKEDGTVSGIPVQLAIGMVKRMDLKAFGVSEDRESKAAEFFGRSLHDNWGVGNNAPSCGGGTGIVIFFSVLDRALYISRGGALERILTNARLDSIIDNNMKSWFRQQRYGDGIKEAIHQLGVYLQKGPPSHKENFAVFWKSYGILLLVAGNGLLLVRGVWKKRHAQKQYARVASQLSQLDRARAEALQGQYRSTSCPICLEDFQVKPPATLSTTAQDQEEIECTEPLTGTNHSHAKHRHGTPPTLDSASTSDMVGSDGLPVKLLRCGHVFDETCWAEWVNKGSSVTRCPICQQNVGGVAEETATNNNERPLMERRHERALRQYQHERYFRLTRLRSRYPDFVQPQQIQRWTQSTYDGTLVQDPTFVKSDPQLQTASPANRTSGGRSGGGSSFGGGFSSGGRGGRW